MFEFIECLNSFIKKKNAAPFQLNCEFLTYPSFSDCYLCFVSNAEEESRTAFESYRSINPQLVYEQSSAND